MIIYESLSLTSCEWRRRGLQQALSLLCNLGVLLSQAASLFRKENLWQSKENVRSLGECLFRSPLQYLKGLILQPLKVGHKGEISRHSGKSALHCKPSLQAPWLSAIRSVLCTLHRFSCFYYIKFFSHPSSLFPHPFISSHPSSPIPHP